MGSAEVNGAELNGAELNGAEVNDVGIRRAEIDGREVHGEDEVDSGDEAGDVAARSDRGDPSAVTRAFVEAIAWGEHHTVWDLLAPEGRRSVLRVAVARGLNEGLSARLRDGTATRGERDTFLTDLVNGLRADLVGNDLERLEYEPDPGFGDDAPDRALVMLVAPLVNPAFLGTPLPVASVELTRAQDGWRVELLRPRAQQ